MRHIQNKNDWFYEMKPFLIMGIGLGGIILKAALGLNFQFSWLSFISGLVLVGASLHIMKARKEHRKKSIMTF